MGGRDFGTGSHRLGDSPQLTPPLRHLCKGLSIDAGRCVRRLYARDDGTVVLHRPR